MCLFLTGVYSKPKDAVAEIIFLIFPWQEDSSSTSVQGMDL